MKTQNEKTTAILNHIIANDKCDNAQIATALNLGKEAVRLILVKLVAENKITATVIGNNKKKIFSVSEKKVEKIKKPKISQIKSASTDTVVFDKKAKKLKPAIVQTAHGLGLMYETDPIVKVKSSNFVTIEKRMVHLVKDNMEPRMSGGKPKKMLIQLSNITIVTPAMPEKTGKVPRVKGAPRVKGESQKDFTKYVFDGNTLSKGRLVHAIIKKFVSEHNPSLVELATAFPEAEIRPYGKLFVHFDEAVKINTDSKRTRFFAKQEDVIKIKGGKIAVSNQIDGELVKRMLAVASAKHNLIVTQA